MPANEEYQSAFPPTRWSLVLQARSGEGGAALEEFCRLYWKPLYALARRQGLSPEDAEDITQDFFRSIIENANQLLGKIDGAPRQLRTFLITAMRRQIIDWHRHRSRKKRGGGKASFPFDPLERFLSSARVDRTPEEEFDRHWATTVLELASVRLRRDYAACGREKHFEILQPFLSLARDPDSVQISAVEKGAGRLYATVENALGVSSSAARQVVHRFRERFRLMLRAEIADTLRFPSDEAIDMEIRHLQASLRH